MMFTIDIIDALNRWSRNKDWKFKNGKFSIEKLTTEEKNGVMVRIDTWRVMWKQDNSDKTIQVGITKKTSPISIPDDLIEGEFNLGLLTFIYNIIYDRDK